MQTKEPTAKKSKLAVASANTSKDLLKRSDPSLVSQYSSSKLGGKQLLAHGENLTLKRKSVKPNPSRPVESTSITHKMVNTVNTPAQPSI